MTTKAQLRKSALALPGATEVAGTFGPTYAVGGHAFAKLLEGNLVHLQLDEQTVRDSLGHCTITRMGPAEGSASITVPLSRLNGMELNNLVFKSWLSVAPTDLVQAARSATKGEAPDGPDKLPVSIGKPATRALLLAGISTLAQVAERTEEELLALHGVGNKAVKVLAKALSQTNREFTR